MTDSIPSPYSQTTPDSRFVPIPIDHLITYVSHNVDRNSTRIWYILSCFSYNHHHTWKGMTGIWGPNGQKSDEIRLSSTMYLRPAIIRYLNWIGWMCQSLDVSIVSSEFNIIGAFLRVGWLRLSRLGWWETRIRRPFHVTLSEYLGIKNCISTWNNFCLICCLFLLYSAWMSSSVVEQVYTVL